MIYLLALETPIGYSIFNCVYSSSLIAQLEFFKIKLKFYLILIESTIDIV